MVRGIRLVSVVACLVAIYPGAGTLPILAPASVVWAADPPPPTAAAASASPAATAATAVAGTPTPDAARRAACERYVAVLSGAKEDKALLRDTEFQALARRMPELATCGAVRRDSDELCGVLEENQSMNCRSTLSVYHEMRTYPKGRSFMMDDVKIKECREHPELAPFCDPFREALRSGDLSKCASTGDLQFLCKAYISLDKSLCQADAADIEGLTAESRKGLEKDCRKAIDAQAPRAQGLKGLAESGSAVERERAKAALRQKDACAPLAQTASDMCVGNTIVVEGTPVPGTPAAKTPAK